MPQQQEGIRAGVIISIVGVFVVGLLALMWIAWSGTVPVASLLFLTALILVCFLAVAAYAIFRVREAQAMQPAEPTPQEASQIIAPAAAEAVATATSTSAGTITITNIGFADRMGDTVAEVKGSCLWTIVCETCQHVFTASRRATAYANAFVGSRDQHPAAHAKAEERGREQLAKLLGDRPPVCSCPKCGYYQKAMVREVRRDRMMRVCGLLAGVYVLLLLFVAREWYRRGSMPTDRELLGLAGCAAAGLAIAGISWLVVGKTKVRGRSW